MGEQLAKLISKGRSKQCYIRLAYSHWWGSAGFHFRASIFINDLNAGLECILSKFADDINEEELLAPSPGAEVWQKDHDKQEV